MGVLQLVRKRSGVRRVFYLKPEYASDRVYATLTHNIFVGVIDQATHHLGHRNASLLGNFHKPSPSFGVESDVQPSPLPSLKSWMRQHT